MYISHREVSSAVSVINTILFIGPVLPADFKPKHSAGSMIAEFPLVARHSLYFFIITYMCTSGGKDASFLVYFISYHVAFISSRCCKCVSVANEIGTV